MSIEPVILIGLDLVADEGRDAVLAEGRGPRKQLVGVQGYIAPHLLLAAAVHILGVAADRRHVLIVTDIEHIIGGVHREHEIRPEIDVDIPAGRDVVAGLGDDGRHQLSIRVGSRAIRTAGRTPVIKGLSPIVVPTHPIPVIEVNRVDRGNVLAEHEDIGVVVFLPVAIFALVGVGISQVQAGLDELPDGVVDPGAHGDTGKAGIGNIAVILQERGGKVSLGLVRAARSGHIILLAGTRTENVTAPQILPFQLSGIGIELAGRGVDDGRVRHARVDIVGAQNLQEAGRRVAVCLSEAHDTRVVHVVAHRFPGHLIVLARIGDDVVRRNGPRVDTHFRIKGDVHLAGGAMLGGDDDDTVGATGAVHGVGRRILEDGDGLQILRRKGVQGAFIRHAVHHDQRRSGCVDRTETTDLEAGAGAGRAGVAGSHQARDRALQGLGDVGSLHSRQFLAAELRGGTGKR